MKNAKNNRMDDHLRGRFKDYELPPSDHLWNKIDEAVNHQEFDEVFKRKLGNREIEPAPEVWDNITRELPINLFIRTTLHRLSKVAAIVLLGFAIWHFGSNNYKAVEEVPILAQQQEKISPTLSIEEESSIDPFNKISYLTVPSSQREAIRKNLDPKPEDTKALLDLILADDESFANKIDSDKIDQILQPITPISFDNAVANIGEELFLPPPIPTDLIISVPLVVIEENEIPSLLEKYDQIETENAKKNQ